MESLLSEVRFEASYPPVLAIYCSDGSVCGGVRLVY
jgi:hypothetical protein